MKTEPLAPSPDEKSCPVTYCLSVIGGKWKPVILFCIANGVDRFGAMQRSVPGITKQMLTKQLRELEANLEASYLLTSRLSNLSLLNYLR